MSTIDIVNPTMFLQAMLTQVGILLEVPTHRDFEYLKSRIKKEGVSFLTLTLPLLDDVLTSSLEQGTIHPRMFPGFRKATHGMYPLLFENIWDCIFDRGTGHLLIHRRAEDVAEAIDCLRQLTRFFKKVELPCTESIRKDSYDRYVSNDQFTGSSRTALDSNFDRFCQTVWFPLEAASGNFFEFPGRPGTGSTEERFLSHQRFTISEWYTRFYPWFPLQMAKHNDDPEHIKNVRELSPEMERPVRVVDVPKTAKGPRIISIEPNCMMFVQQSLAKALMGFLAANPLYEGIQFRDQEKNREAAKKASIDGRSATIDLSDASDRVSLALVRRIFASAPTFLSMLEAARSTHARLPDGGLIRLNKFASMGSALCFPVEAMVFWTIAAYFLTCMRGQPAWVPTEYWYSLRVRNSIVPSFDSLSDGWKHTAVYEQEHGRVPSRLPGYPMFSQWGEQFPCLPPDPRIATSVLCELWPTVEQSEATGGDNVVTSRETRAYACQPLKASGWLGRYAQRILPVTWSFTTSGIRKAIKGLLVYGDDIILPLQTALTAEEDDRLRMVELRSRHRHHRREVGCSFMDLLTEFELVPNVEKSFTQGFFRESCGGDYWKGHLVTPVYLRHDITATDLPKSASLMASAVSLSNQFYMKGWWHVAQTIRDHVDTKYKSRTRGSGPKGIPVAAVPVGCLHYSSVHFTGPCEYWAPLHGYVLRGPTLVAKRQPDGFRDVSGAICFSFVGNEIRLQSSARFERPRRVAYRQYPSLIRGGETEHVHSGWSTSPYWSSDMGTTVCSIEATTSPCTRSVVVLGPRDWTRNVSRDSVCRIETTSGDTATSVRPYALSLKHRRHRVF